MQNNLFQHFQKDELPFVEKAIDIVERVNNIQAPILTDFIDPRQAEIINSIVNSNIGLTMFFDGGYTSAERVRVLIAPDYWQPTDKELGLRYFKVKGLNRFDQLEHKDYMGALLNIGIKREKFGDILLTDNMSQYIVATEIADYVSLELTKIKHSRIELVEINKEELVVPGKSYQMLTITVASLRVDNILSQVYNQSRDKVGQLIRANKLKVNWRPIDKTDYQLKVGDKVSLRGFGRFEFLVEEGNTKKGKHRIKIGKLV